MNEVDLEINDVPPSGVVYLILDASGAPVDWRPTPRMARQLVEAIPGSSYMAQRVAEPGAVAR